MEIITTILFVLVGILFYRILTLEKRVNVNSFSDRAVNKLLVKKEIIDQSEIETIINESIGDMPEDAGNKIIKDAKSIGINIPKYMDEGELEKYIENQKLKRMESQISYTDRMMMND